MATTTLETTPSHTRDLHLHIVCLPWVQHHCLWRSDYPDEMRGTCCCVSVSESSALVRQVQVVASQGRWLQCRASPCVCARMTGNKRVLSEIPHECTTMPCANVHSTYTTSAQRPQATQPLHTTPTHPPLHTTPKKTPPANITKNSCANQNANQPVLRYCLSPCPLPQLQIHTPSCW